MVVESLSQKTVIVRSRSRRILERARQVLREVEDKRERGSVETAKEVSMEDWIDEALKRIREARGRLRAPSYFSTERRGMMEGELERLEAFIHDYARENEGADFVWESFWREIHQKLYPELKGSPDKKREYDKIYGRVRRLCDPIFNIEQHNRLRKWADTHPEKMRGYRDKFRQLHREDLRRYYAEEEMEVRNIIKKVRGGKCEACRKTLDYSFECHEEDKTREYRIDRHGKRRPKRPSDTNWFLRCRKEYRRWKRGEITEGDRDKCFREHIPKGVHLVHPHRCHAEIARRFP